MITYQEALRIIGKHASPIGKETWALMDGLGKISAADIESPMQLPSFRNAAMDGFAVRRADLAAASTAQPLTLPVAGIVAAGDASSHQANGALQIMTGALVPEPFDAVIPIEDVVVQDSNVTFTRPAKEHENIRFPGEDVPKGQPVLRQGQVITPERLMLLAALGIDKVEIWKLPDIYIFATGKEITEPTASLLSLGKIYNSNAPYLLACCQQERFTAHYGGIIADDAEEFESRINAIPAGSVIISTGAVSKGAWDFIPDSLKRIGAHIHFHRVNIRPGKPVLFATLPNGSYFLGLPGNPISAAVGFRFFVMPLLLTMQGLPLEQPIMAKLQNSFIKKGNFRQFVKANLRTTGNGEWIVSVSSGQESFKISPLAEGNAFAVLAEELLECEPGMLVPVFPYGARGRIKVEISLYGAFKQISTNDTLTLDMPHGVTLREVKTALGEEIAKRYPGFSQQKLLDSSPFADETTILRKQDVLLRDTKLAIIPPISGG